MNDKTIIALGALFFALSNPYTYQLVDSVVPVLDSNGPTPLGVLFHTIVFCIVLTFMSKTKALNKLV
jgi:hypothetical protein